MMNIKLFEELVISEYDLSLIIKDYIFPSKYYNNKLKTLNLSFDKNTSNNKLKKIILKNHKKINFRTKNIIFIGYSNKKSEKYYFLQLTTIKKEFIKQCIYLKHINGKIVYANLNKFFYFNFKNQKVWTSKFNKNKNNIIQDHYWKNNLLNNMPINMIKSLSKKTNINIYENKLQESIFWEED